jgi:GTP-binding protein EngB required for normal cell division
MSLALPQHNFDANFFHVPNQSDSEASHHTEETCNIIVFGETGIGKSSLINLLTKKHTAPTSYESTGCTTTINMYEFLMLNNLLKVKLFDTPGQYKFAAHASDCC